MGETGNDRNQQKLLFSIYLIDMLINKSWNYTFNLAGYASFTKNIGLVPLLTHNTWHEMEYALMHIYPPQIMPICVG